jgi:hypothetical protein
MSFGRRSLSGASLIKLLNWDVQPSDSFFCSNVGKEVFVLYKNVEGSEVKVHLNLIQGW